MKLTVIGGDATWGTSAGASGYLVESMGSSLVLDCGVGTAVTFPRYAPLASLVGIAISHLHPDNWFDLLPLAFAARIEQSDFLMLSRPDGTYNGDNLANVLPESPRRIPVYLPSEGSAYVRKIIEAYEDAAGMQRFFSPVLPLHELTTGETVSVGPFRITAFTVSHGSTPSIGFRITDGIASIGYSGETGMCDTLNDIARDVDLFLCDTTTMTEDIRTIHANRHLSAENAGKVAQQAGAKQLVLTHLIHNTEEWFESLRRTANINYTGLTSVARPGAVFLVPR